MTEGPREAVGGGKGREGRGESGSTPQRGHLSWAILFEVTRKEKEGHPGCWQLCGSRPRRLRVNTSDRSQVPASLRMMSSQHSLEFMLWSLGAPERHEQGNYGVRLVIEKSPSSSSPKLGRCQGEGTEAGPPPQPVCPVRGKVDGGGALYLRSTLLPGAWPPGAVHTLFPGCPEDSYTVVKTQKSLPGPEWGLGLFFPAMPTGRTSGTDSLPY